MDPQKLVVDTFQERFGEAPSFVIRAPGRVNLIGEHTDYNDGFVLPMAIDRAVWLALRPRDDELVTIHSADFGSDAAFSLRGLEHTAAGWSEYLKGVAWALLEAGHRLRGWEGILAGNVPVGAGLSSSAALELATARAFAAVSDLDWDAKAMAKLGQKAENEWVGMNCGIMDQMISAAGDEDHALLIDCRSLDLQAVPLPPETVVVILDTATRRGLVDSAYNERRAQCEAAARFFGVPALRDVSTGELEAASNELDRLTFTRARHVVTENARTLEAAEAMQAGDAQAMGRLMNASHASLRDDFQVSRQELDIMAAYAQQQKGCYGARMTGAGFGGCAVALVQRQAAEVFAQKITTAYEQATSLMPRVYVCRATDGASVMPHHVRPDASPRDHF